MQKHILVVEDRPEAMRRQYKELKEKGFALTISESLKEAVDIIKDSSKHFDAAIIDVIMPCRDIPVELEIFVTSGGIYGEALGIPLGCWLETTRPGMPFFYVTIEPSLVTVVHSSGGGYRGVLDKSKRKDMVREFVEKMNWSVP